MKLPGADPSVVVEAFRRQHRTGLVTLLFTDLVNSVELRRQLGDQAATTLVQSHRAAVRELLRRLTDAEEIETAGDSFLLLFIRPSDAVKFALLLEQRTRILAQDNRVALAQRIGIHVGEVVIEEHATGPKPKDLHGSQIDLCARVMSLAEGGQILLTRGVFDSARQAIKGEEVAGVGELSWLNHGPYLLKGIDEPVEICEVGEVGIAPLHAPADSEKARRQTSSDGEPVLGWRPALDQVVPNTQWMLEQKLGQGGFGEVWLGRHQTMKERRVLKFCFRADRARSLKREMTLFRVIKERIGDHPHIVALREVYFDAPPFYVMMDYVEGQDLKAWCAQQGGVERVSLEVRLEIVAQIAAALQAAHDAGVIHRDVKPGNILIADWGKTKPANLHLDSGTPNRSSAIRHATFSAKLTDFGIGQVISAEALEGVTKAGFTGTIVAETSSSHSGSQMYMAPELLAGKAASPSSDVYSLGVVLYQLLVGDFARPLTTDWSDQIADPLLREDLRRCFTGNPQDRFSSARELADNLVRLPQRQSARRDTEATQALRAQASRRWRALRLAGVGVVIVVLGLAVISILMRGAKVRQAREQTLPEIVRLSAAGRYAEAFTLAQQAERYVPNDPILATLWPQIAVTLSIETVPAGAQIGFKEYSQPGSSWQHLGKSPLLRARFPRGSYRWRFTQQGYETVELGAKPEAGILKIVLDAAGTLPSGMVRVRGANFRTAMWSMDHLKPVELEDFLIDKFEVSNRQFKEFVDQKGYETASYWKLPLFKAGRPVSKAEVMQLFRDKSGRPGPSTWSNGSFPEGQGDYPVGGASWYEAAAYAEFVGKSLPTLFHWDHAAGTRSVTEIRPLSNFDGRGPALIGSYHGMSPSGAFDMAGNMAEWIWNEGEPGKRWIAGGAWSDPPYMFVTLDASDPWNRDATRGFRCMKLLSENEPPPATLSPATPVFRDYQKETPVSDEVFQSFRGFYAYDKTGLEPRSESIDDRSPLWRKEKVSFNAAYGSERIPAYLFLPKHGTPPFQTIIYYPGASVIQQPSSDLHMTKLDTGDSDLIEIVLQSGRAFFYPIYKGTFERSIGLTTTRQNTTSAHRDNMIQVVKDFQRSVDYLETRKDIDSQRFGYLGLSWGARIGNLFLALDNRLKAAVLILGGLPMERAAPEVDQFNFAPRIQIPVLMLNGRYDPIFAVESQQIKMFRLLGTPDKHKRYVIYEIGHHRLLQADLKHELPTWFDRYLGPAKSEGGDVRR